MNIYSLLTWKREEDTWQIFIPVCLAFLVCLFLHIDTILFVFGELHHLIITTVVIIVIRGWLMM